MVHGLEHESLVDVGIAVAAVEAHCFAAETAAGEAEVVAAVLEPHLEK